jgi:hypothetical protein
VGAAADALDVRRQRRLRVSTLSNAVVEPEARALHRRQLNSSSVSNGFMFAAVVKRKNKP